MITSIGNNIFINEGWVICKGNMYTTYDLKRRLCSKPRVHGNYYSNEKLTYISKELME